ncbi:MAG: preprotein translocase subunit SecD [Oscillospiraceae bacterium]|jgi:protein-export membrane protein SecD
MRKVGKPVFFVVVLLIALMTILSFVGIHWQYGDITTTYIKGAKDIRWGIDIRGGVDVTFSPPEGYDAAPEDISKAQAIIETRLINLNIADYEIYPDMERDRIIVRFPWKSDEENFNPEKAIEELGDTAMLTFREGAEVDANGQPTGVTENVILTGNDVESAQYMYGALSENGAPQHFVALSFKESGKEAFADATARLQGSQISIWMDEEMISAPRVNAHITDGQAIIEGQFTAASAAELARKIQGGALPFKLTTENYSTISPSLGEGAKNAMVLAGVIAYLAVCAFIIWKYRLPGVVASISLAGQVGLMIAAITGFFGFVPSFTLTLPGIAGIILSIGFGVDASIITAERIREEMAIGKTIDGSILAGFNRAFSAIFDGNITVIIVSVILMGAFGPPNSFFAKILRPVFFMFGPTTAGAIYSFGYTLLMGVLANFIMGIFAARMMLRSLCRFRPFRKVWLYGGEK